MALQLLCRNDVKDFGTWKKVFDADAEDQRDAGLSLLQLWRAADAPGTVFMLFRVNDRDKAEAYLNRADAGMHADSAGMISGEFHFVETT